MEWTLSEALETYARQGAPHDQSALIALLKEIQQQKGLTPQMLTAVAEAYGCKESLLLAIVKRIPSLRLADTHTLEICGGANCAKRARLAAIVEKLCGKNHPGLEIRTVGCMRQCGKGPNLKYDGVLFNQADEALLRRLLQK